MWPTTLLVGSRTDHDSPSWLLLLFTGTGKETSHDKAASELNKRTFTCTEPQANAMVSRKLHLTCHPPVKPGLKKQALPSSPEG